MKPVKVKICGLTREADVRSAVAAGVDAVGVVFAKSPRQVSVPQAAKCLAKVPSGVLKVGLFMNQSRQEVGQIIGALRLDLLQFHGPAENDWCASFGLPFLRAISVDSDRAILQARRYPDAVGILFDTPAPGGAGGTGRTFDWSLLSGIDCPFWLAGGLNPENVTQAVKTLDPDWVDVSSGVEDGPGLKNPELMSAFITAAKSARREWKTEELN